MNSSFLEFALQIGQLKQLKRTGWINNGVPEPESVAEHSWRMGLLAMVLAPYYGADAGHAAQMAIIHDLGEIKIGDVVTDRGAEQIQNREDKVSAERAGLLEILHVGGVPQFIELFDEFEQQQTPEALLVKDLDKFEMALQAAQYERDHQLNLDEFFANARKHIKNSELAALLDKL